MSVSAETFGMEEQRSRRYRGLNPSFAKRVWQKRRAAKPKKTIGEIVAEMAAKRRAEQAERVAELVAEAGSVMDIIAAVAKAHDVTVEGILGRRLTKPMIEARQLAMVEVVKRRPDLSIARIAKSFKRDHTTVLHAMKKYGVTR